MEAMQKQYARRNAILACLRRSHAHPSAEAVLAALKPAYPKLSLGTVYRNLALFKEQGLIASVGTVAGVERFDGNVTPHPHFICRICGDIRDLADIPIPPALIESAQESGCTVEQCALTFCGVCDSCKNLRISP